MDRNKLYKEQYDAEWNHRSHLLGMTNFCMVAATVIGTALVAAAQNFDYTPEHSTFFFVLLLLASLVTLAVSFYYIGRALIGKDYKYLPKPKQLEDYHAEIAAWTKQKGSKTGPDAEFEQNLQEMIATAASANFDTNRAKAFFVQRALTNISWSLVLLATAAVPYLLGSTGIVQAMLSLFTDNPL